MAKTKIQNIPVGPFPAMLVGAEVNGRPAGRLACIKGTGP
jgi:hypothetical protein